MRVLILLLLFFAPLAAYAQTLEEIYRVDDAGLRLMRDGGARYVGPLSLERVPSGSYVIELALAFGDNVVRYPIKARRESGRWVLQWQPDGVYAGALLAMVKGGKLPASPGDGTQWAEVSRFPGLPIIATKSRIVTPFGEVDPADRVEGESQGDLEVSGELQRHVQAWISRVLEGDEAPAGFDLILASDVSWRLANKLLFNAAIQGLHQITLVTADGYALALSAPVTDPAPVAVAMYRLEKGFGFRVLRGGNVQPGDGCAPEMTFCSTDAAQFVVDAQHVMFAATGEVTVGEVVPFLAVLGARRTAQGPATIMGYLQKMRYLLTLTVLGALSCQTTAPTSTPAPAPPSVDLSDPFAVAEAWLRSPSGESAVTVQQWKTPVIERLRCAPSSEACSVLVVSEHGETLTLSMRRGGAGWEIL